MTSIAIVVLDTVRKDTFEKHFDWLPGIHFKNAYSTSHWTIPAHASLYTGYYPSELGVHGKSTSLDCSEPVLAEQLQKKGYATQLISANPNIVYHDGWGRGFDEVKTPYDLFEELKLDEITPHPDVAVPGNAFNWPQFVKSSDKTGLPLYYEGIKRCFMEDCATVPSILFAAHLKGHGGVDSLLIDDGADIVSNYVRDQEFGDSEFLLINLMEAHNPYDPPKEYNTAGEPVDAVFGQALADEVNNEDRVRQAYDDAVRYLANIYKDMFEKLQQSFDYVITLSDHGECLGEYDMWNHGYGLYPELVHVPLVFSGGELDQMQDQSNEQSVISLLDIYQTVCDLAGISVDSRGKNILQMTRDESVLTEYHGLLSWHYEQLRRYGISEEEMEAYEPPLDGIVNPSGQYGYETHTSGFVSGYDEKKELQQDLKSTREGVERITPDERSKELATEVKSQLRELGYM